jgi:Yip1 domain
MLKAVVLIFFPARAWDAIVQSRRRIAYILFIQLLPLLLLASAAEGYGLVHWGKWQGEITPQLKHFPVQEVVVFQAAQLVLNLVLVGIASLFVRSFARTFHARHTFEQAFGTVAYGLSPLFLCRMLDAFSFLPPWVPWGLGILLSLSALYHGVPRMMDPDPAHAFGLFFMTSLLLLVLTGLLRLVVMLYLQGKFPRWEEWMIRIGAKLPF